MIKNAIAKCIPCQAVGTDVKEPISSTEMPKRPWDKLHMDFYGPLPSGDFLLLVIDRYFRSSEVVVVRSTKASCVIPKLDIIFAVHGIPIVIKTANAPPFIGVFYTSMAARKCRSETFHATISYKVLKTAMITQRPWKEELQRFCPNIVRHHIDPQVYLEQSYFSTEQCKDSYQPS